MLDNTKKICYTVNTRIGKAPIKDKSKPHGGKEKWK